MTYDTIKVTVSLRTAGTGADEDAAELWRQMREDAKADPAHKMTLETRSWVADVTPLGGTARISDEDRAAIVKQMYQQARHLVDSRGGNLQVIRELVGLRIYRALIAEEILRVAAASGIENDTAVRWMITEQYRLLDEDLPIGGAS